MPAARTVRKVGGLELKAPAGLGAFGTEDEQDGDDEPERDEDAERVYQAVATEPAALFA